MKELDVLLEEYLAHCYRDSGPDQQALFEELLELQDPDLYTYVTGRARPEREDLRALVDTIRELKSTRRKSS